VLKSLLWHSAAGCAAAALAFISNFAGVETTLTGAAAAAAAYSAWWSFRGNRNLHASKNGSAQPGNDSSERYRSAFDYAAIGMALVSSEGRWLRVNRALCELLGYEEQEILATDFLSAVKLDDFKTAAEGIKRLWEGDGSVIEAEIRLRHKSGRDVWGMWSASLAADPSGRRSQMIFQIQDVTDRRRAEARLQHEALHDGLTNLPNRAMFMDRLELAIARAHRHGERNFAVLYLDLDRFKVINDSLGHAVGDQLLIEVARRLGGCVRAGDTVSRFGGDEFVLLIEDIQEEAEAVEVAERIKSELALPFDICGREVFTSASVGVASSWTSYHEAEGLVRDADAALYRAKSHGKNRHEIYDSAMHAHANDRLQMEMALRLAVERREFIVYYQPIVDLDDFKLRGFEALVRWNHPEKGFVSPADFIPLAEEMGLIVEIGEWVLEESCRQMERWQKIFPTDPPMFMSVNLSGRQFIQNDLVERIAAVIRETRVDPRGLKLEITESAVMDDVEAATKTFRRLKELGLRLSIDDFGTGYSSLSYLHKFPLDTLKIDRSFVMKMSESAENREIVLAIVTLAQNLGMSVIAEGVETKEQVAELRDLGCEFGQGYFFSKPAPAEGAEHLICDTYPLEAAA
jgi:diguanylate cyclase (GGDEF)-like protein/PAS domain S-box-containing protein